LGSGIPQNESLGYVDLGDEEEFEEEMSAIGGLTRASDAIMQTPFRSQTEFQKYPKQNNAPS
jgi:hypothetical protein